MSDGGGDGVTINGNGGGGGGGGVGTTGLCVFSCTAVLSAVGAIVALYDYDIGPESAFFAVNGIGGLCFAKCQYLRLAEEKKKERYKKALMRQDVMMSLDHNDLPYANSFFLPTFVKGSLPPEQLLGIRRKRRNNDQGIALAEEGEPPPLNKSDVIEGLVKANKKYKVGKKQIKNRGKYYQ